MKVQSKKDKYVVETITNKNVMEVMKFINPKCHYLSDWRFVIKHTEELIDDKNLFESIPSFHKDLPVISFEEWQSLPDFTKPEYDPKDVAFNQRKVIGYKLIKPEYWKSVLIITGIVNLESDTEEQKKKYVIDWMKHDNYGFARKLREAGVLNIWFEPVYEKESITLKSGTKLSEDDIAEVKEILNNK